MSESSVEALKLSDDVWQGSNEQGNFAFKFDHFNKSTKPLPYVCLDMNLL